LSVVFLFAAAGCSPQGGSDVATGESMDGLTTAETTSFAWPASLKVMGDGYPAAGDTCRRLGESDATINYLDDSSTLVGCPGVDTSSAARALLASTDAVAVGDVDGVTMFAIPFDPTALTNAETTGEIDLTTHKGILTGIEVAEYTVEAHAGQTINVSLDGRGSMYFNVMPPSDGAALYVGSRAIDSADFWAGVAPESGNYKVIIYLMGNDRDANISRSYELRAVAE
jgi:hypothetical protein